MLIPKEGCFPQTSHTDAIDHYLVLGPGAAAGGRLDGSSSASG